MQTKNVTYEDIARYTNFSKTTISRYFNDPDSLKIENQQKIAQALIDLNYQKNKLARILANGKSEFIGIIIPNMFLHYYAEILNQILTTYETYDYKFLVFLGDDDIEKEKKYIQELLSYKIEGLIILSHTIPSRDLKDYDIPIVTIEREDDYTNSVNTDNYAGACQATQLLIDNDCDVLVHINTNVKNYIPAKGRIDGFKDTCKKAGIPYELIFSDFGNTFDITNDRLIKLLDQIEEKYKDKKVGIFVSNDTYANIILNEIFRRYGKLPDKYEIIGFDDSPIASQAILPITTVGQQIEDLVKESMEILVSQMENRKKRRPKPVHGVVHKKVEPKLIQRKTTSKRKNDN